MTASNLEAFVAVAAHLKLTVAARQLRISQPALSRRIKTLEVEIGAPLLVRTSRGVALSPAGERFIGHARRALEALRSGVDEVKELSGQAIGGVALGAIPSVGTYLLPPVVALMRKACPGVTLRLAEGISATLEERVARGELDLALLTLPLRRLDLVVQKLWEEHLVLVVPRGHRLTRQRQPIPLAAIGDEPLLVYPRLPDAVIGAAFEQVGVAPNVVIETESAESLLQMVGRGLGVALMRSSLVLNHPKPTFSVVRVGRGAPIRRVGLVHRGDESLSLGARTLKQLIVANLHG
ncbi:MAG TPA: LysR family transcriptional regulator [Kofleriaceae bacterium]|nr:LysR family transcriptional regulator [Kofleriaceae bacterium]